MFWLNRLLASACLLTTFVFPLVTADNGTESSRRQPTAMVNGSGDDPYDLLDGNNVTSVENWVGIVSDQEKEKWKATALVWIETIASNLPKTEKAFDNFQALLHFDGRTASTLLKVSRTLSALATGIGFASSILDFVLSFFVPTELDIIQKQFQKLFIKVDDLGLMMEQQTDEIKSSIEFHSWLVEFDGWQSRISNGRQKLRTIMERAKTSTDPEEKQILMQEFLDYFVNSDVEGALRNIHQLSGQRGSTFKPNIFQLFSDEFGYKPTELSRLMAVLTGVFLDGCRQMVTYSALRYGVESAVSTFDEVYLLLDDIRVQYELHLWYIMRDIKRHVDATVRSLLDKDTSLLTNNELSEAIQNELSSQYSWYAWAVVITGQDGVYTRGTYESRGNEYLLVRNVGQRKDKNVLVVWQDAEQKAISCMDAMQGSTLVFIAGTEGQSSMDIASSEDIMTSSSCWSTRYQIQESYLRRFTDYGMPQWLASVSDQASSGCADGKACSQRGRCLVIPSTARSFCICDSGNYGADCKSRTSLRAESSVVQMLAALRRSFGNVGDATSIVDAHAAIGQLDATSDDGREQVLDVLDHLKSIVANGDVLNKAQYIQTRHDQLITGQIDEDAFGRYMDDIQKTESIDYILVEIRNALLGVGLLDGTSGDILTTFKKSYLAHKGNSLACTDQYAADVNRMIQKLASLDEKTSEALIIYMKWKLTDAPEEAQRSILNDMLGYLADAQSRLDGYFRTWSKQSCPTLGHVPDLVQRNCTEMLSYQGMILDLACRSDKMPIPTRIECVQNGTGLSWSQVPRCEYFWSDWSAWSKCDRTCGGGKQTRRRSKPNGQLDEEYQECQSQDCCQQKYNKWKCASGQCIKSSQQCNGRFDCDDHSDESSCDYFRSGDIISLQNVRGGYLDCACVQNGCGGWLKKKKTCTGVSDDAASRFRIFNTREPGSAILHGDVVLFQYQPTSKWFRCLRDKCDTASCSVSPEPASSDINCRGGLFQILDPDRRGECRSPSTGCLGEPVKSGDQVFVSLGQSRWLSGAKDEAITTANCPGQQLDSADGKCWKEIWIMHKY